MLAPPRCRPLGLQAPVPAGAKEAAQAAAAALKELSPGAAVGIAAAGSTGHETQPPGRFSEGSLVRALEEAGIGRPSTYASIIKLLQVGWTFSYRFTSGKGCPE